MDGTKHITAWVCAATILLLLGLCLPALAKERCQADAEKFCPGTTAGTKEYADCLKQHVKELSKPCKNQLGEAQARANDLKMYPSCLAEVEKFCPGTKPGGGRIMLCLRTHQGNLSSECKDELRDHGQLR